MAARLYVDIHDRVFYGAVPENEWRTLTRLWGAQESAGLVFCEPRVMRFGPYTDKGEAEEVRAAQQKFLDAEKLKIAKRILSKKSKPRLPDRDARVIVEKRR